MGLFSNLFRKIETTRPEDIAKRSLLDNRQSDYSQAIQRTYLTRAGKTAEAAEAAENRFMWCMWQSWAMGAIAVTAYLGGYSIGMGSEDSEELVNTLDKAKSRFELGIQLMVSRWFWKWYLERSHTIDQREDAVRVSLINIQTFLDMKCEDTVNLYLGFNRQFLQSVPKDKGVERLLPPFSYVDMFYQRYWECVTGEQIVDWTRLRFPLKSYGEFLAACLHGKRHHPDGKQSDSMLDPAESIVLWKGIIEAGGVMFDHFNKAYQKP